jgi:transglutaminase-like putative cysteine protease
MRLRILHETRYDYSPPVQDGEHVAHLKPLNQGHQRLLSYALRITPEPFQLRESVDAFGNRRHDFSLRQPHGSLQVESESLVQTEAPPPRHPAPAWEKVRESVARGQWPQAQPFAQASPCVSLDPAFADFAQASFAPGRPLDEAAWDLMQRIHRRMRYVPESTGVSTSALQALAQGQGVCQDFAHILLACCRSLGLPARYVSGYLLTQPPPGQSRLIGSDASHAWASVLCPAVGPDGEPDVSQPAAWLDLDPTNDRQPGEDYVTLAVGRDFSDVSPLAGVIRGGDRHVLSVAVTVRPEEEAARGA